MIRDEKLQYDINKKAAKISALSSGKTGKYQYLIGKGVLSSHQSRIIEHANFTYCPFGQDFIKQAKTIEDQGIKQFEALKALKSEENKQDRKSVEGTFPKDTRTNKTKNEGDEIKKWEKEFKRKDLKYETKKYKYYFQ